MAEHASTRPDLHVVRSVIERACRAPSIHNSQPWRWVLDGDWLQLYADRRRSVPVADPSGRELLISCGAALHHARIGLAAAGWSGLVERLPDRDHPDHLASISFTAAAADPEDELLSLMISRRRTDRRRFSSWTVPSGLLTKLTDCATAQGAILVPVVDPRLRLELTGAIADAAVRHEHEWAYNRELASWAGRGATAVQGIPPGNIPEGRRQYGDTVMRSFPGGRLESEDGNEQDAGELAVIATSSDDRLSQLRAGEALSAVLLAATSLNLATCPLTEPMEIARTRHTIGQQVLNGIAIPQVVLRLGWAPISNPDLAETPRRSVEDVLTIR